jgi:heme oxygenase
MGIMDRLKEGTKSLHDAAEGHAFQRTLFAGQLSRVSYADYLGQMYCLYAALEDALRQAQTHRPEISTVVKPHNLRQDDLTSDLAHFGLDPTKVSPLPATRALIDAIKDTRSTNPLALLGMHYVLEGSNNGNHYIAKNIRKAYDLDDAGARFLDPYGEGQRSRWAEYKQALGAVNLTEAESDALLAAAQEMFRAIGRISQELDAARHPATR